MIVRIVNKRDIKVAMREAQETGNDLAYGYLQAILMRLDADDYAGALDYAKRHGFDLVAIHNKRWKGQHERRKLAVLVPPVEGQPNVGLHFDSRSGRLGSQWRAVDQTNELHSVRVDFQVVHNTIKRKNSASKKRVKTDADTPYRTAN